MWAKETCYGGLCGRSNSINDPFDATYTTHHMYETKTRVETETASLLHIEEKNTLILKILCFYIHSIYCTVSLGMKDFPRQETSFFHFLFPFREDCGARNPYDGGTLSSFDEWEKWKETFLFCILFFFVKEHITDLLMFMFYWLWCWEWD